MPSDPPIGQDTPVDWDAVEEAAAEAGCVAFHRKRDDEMNDKRQRSSTFIASDAAGLVDQVLVAAEEYNIEFRKSLVEQVIAGLREEMER